MIGLLGSASKHLAGAAEPGPPMTRVTEKVEDQLDRWFAEVKTGDPDRVTALYSADAILLPTLRGDVKEGQQRIREYLSQDFLPRNPVGSCVERHTRVIGDVGVNSGIYRFLMTGTDSGRAMAEARFTFVYQWIEDDWKIIEHHSSFNPESQQVT